MPFSPTRPLASVPLLTFLLSAIVATAVRAEGSYEYHDKSPLALGRGFDPKFPLRVYGIPCIDSTGRENIDGAGIARVDISTSIVKSQEDYYSATGFSAKIDAHYKFFSGGTTHSKSRQFSRSDDSLTWIVKAEIVFGRYRLKAPKLSDAARAVMSSAWQFTNTCGPEFGAQETRGARAMLVFSARNLSTDSKQKLERAIYASYSSPGAGVEASVQYRSIINEIRKTSIIEHGFLAVGGPGPEALKTMIADVDDPIKLRNGLATYFSGITELNAVPLHLETASFAQFGANVLGGVFSNRDNALMQMSNRYQDLQAVMDRIYSYIRPDDSVSSYLRTYVSEAQRSALEAHLVKYAERSTLIYNQARTCLEDERSCNPPVISDIERVEFPEIPEVPAPKLLVQCPFPYFSDTRDPPADTLVIGRGGVVVGFSDQVPIKRVLFEYFGEKDEVSVFDLFQTERVSRSELIAIDRANNFRTQPVPIKDVIAQIRLEEWQPHSLCTSSGDLDNARVWKQFAAFKFDQRAKKMPINIQIIDAFERRRSIQMNWQ